jgi:hypothetical protein
MARREFAAKLFELNRLINSAFRPQTACAIAAKSNAGVFVTCLKAASLKLRMVSRNRAGSGAAAPSDYM